MYDTIDAIEALFNEEAESFAIEYKSGRVFDNLSSNVRSEFVKDVSAFANGGGGTLIIGVAEGREDERRIATGFDPVTNDRVSVEQLTNIIKSNTDPVFSAFDIRTLDHANGRVFVIEVKQADTAHQNRMDQRYYQRTGMISEPMYDFAIRDVMNRRSRPRIEVSIVIERVEQKAERHRYRVVPSLSNVGHLNASHWCLHLDRPSDVARLGPGSLWPAVRELARVRRDGVTYTRCEFLSTVTPGNLHPTPLLPGQNISLGPACGYADLELVVDHNSWRSLMQQGEPPLRWTLYSDDCPPQEGELSFDVWCNF
ncbi:Putative DNA-binding domain-containing protein [Burkholderia diffusa]|uniref:AlbA family DNA-binding domain-containing protein n=1 Tax=Burkholderia diffusa TaxID=488732 RepID=UPI001CB1F67F|nr:ATP-binding protein [Burkholderia diffusa]CAG9250180.1 Putative DNA-binding domain-containing protein [Burkholderia diffusa]